MTDPAEAVSRPPAVPTHDFSVCRWRCCWMFFWFCRPLRAIFLGCFYLKQLSMLLIIQPKGSSTDGSCFKRFARFARCSRSPLWRRASAASGRAPEAPGERCGWDEIWREKRLLVLDQYHYISKMKMDRILRWMFFGGIGLYIFLICAQCVTGKRWVLQPECSNWWEAKCWESP